METDDCGSGNNISSANNEADYKSCEVSLRKEKVPRKIIHCSDGVIEEYSSDEDEPPEVTNKLNPSTLPWGPWIWYHTVNVGSKSLHVCDYLGEHLARLFGITTPKYQYEINEHNRMMAEEEERQSKQDLEMGGWRGIPTENEDTVQAAPIQQNDMPPPAAKGNLDVHV